MAAKSYFGNLSAASGPVELAVSLLAFRHGTVPRTLNCDDPDPACPVAVLRQPKPVTKPYVVKVSLTDAGQCAAAVVKKWD